MSMYSFEVYVKWKIQLIDKEREVIGKNIDIKWRSYCWRNYWFSKKNDRLNCKKRTEREWMKKREKKNSTQGPINLVRYLSLILDCQAEHVHESVLIYVFEASRAEFYHCIHNDICFFTSVLQLLVQALGNVLWTANLALSTALIGEFATWLVIVVK